MRTLEATALLLALVGCSDVMEESYPTWADAKRGGAVQRGWIPAFIPVGAYDIRDTHDLDTNAQTLRFITPRSDVREMIAALAPVSADDKAAAEALSAGLGLPRTSEAYVVCSGHRNGTLLVDRESGHTIYKTPVQWVDDDCSRAP